MFKILLGLSNILNITKENSRRNRGSGCGGRSRGQWFLAAMTVAMVSAVNSGNGNGGGRQGWWKRQRWGQTTINHKAVAIADENGDGGGGDGDSHGSGSGNGAAAQMAAAAMAVREIYIKRGRIGGHGGNGGNGGGSRSGDGGCSNGGMMQGRGGQGGSFLLWYIVELGSGLIGRVHRQQFLYLISTPLWYKTAQ
jgi:hypothetical protein